MKNLERAILALMLMLMMFDVPATAAETVVLLTTKNTDTVWIESVYKHGTDVRVGNDCIVGGWGDWYESYIRFDVSAMPKDVEKVILRLYTTPRDGRDKNETMSDMEVREVSYTCPVKLPSEKDAPSTWLPERISYGMRPSSFFISRVAVREGGWVDINITHLYRKWKEGEKNHGLHFIPLNNGNSFTTIKGPKDEEYRPRLVITN